MKRQFERTIGIDYSGAGEPNSTQAGLSVFMTERGSPACEIPPPSGYKNWKRRELTEWLTSRLAESTPTIAAIDHAFSFPKPYFEKYKLELSWDKFLEDFYEHWPTHKYAVKPLREGKNEKAKKAQARLVETNWLRETEKRCKKRKHPANSVFDFKKKQGQVATSTHAGLSFLWQMRKCESLSDLHIWPFDEGKVGDDKSCLVEAYPRLYKCDDYEKKFYSNKTYSKSEHARDAFVTASWLRDMDNDKGELQSYLDLESQLPKEALERAKYEGWIIGTPDID